MSSGDRNQHNVSPDSRCRHKGWILEPRFGAVPYKIFAVCTGIPRAYRTVANDVQQKIEPIAISIRVRGSFKPCEQSRSSRGTMKSEDLDDLFCSYDCRSLLTGKRMVVMGDSSKNTGNDRINCQHARNYFLPVQRSVYKDFVLFLQEDRLLDESELRRKVTCLDPKILQNVMRLFHSGRILSRKRHTRLRWTKREDVQLDIIQRTSYLQPH